ncbi:MAG: NHL repeat-containing protein [Rhizomicrobium sp.]|jgi:hypothetical protein
MRSHSALLGVLAAGAVIALSQSAPAVAGSGGFNKPGDLLIADQFNNRVIEVDKQGTIVWSFGLGPNDFSPNSIVGVNDAERVGKDTLMAGTGIPAGVDPNCEDGCSDNRVILVDPSGNIVWQYGQFGVTGSGPNELNTPVQVTYTPKKTVLITDQGNQRIIEVDRAGNIVWQYGMTGVPGSGFDELNSPNSAQLIGNRDVLIADEGNNRVIVVDKKSKKVRSAFTAQGTMSAPAFASLLPSGDILVTDGGNNRVITVDSGDKVGFQYFTNLQNGSNPNPAPSQAVETKKHLIVISDQFNDRVIAVDLKGNLHTQYGNLNQSGYGTENTSQGLFAPYGAKVIGDYTGLTPPN